MKLSQADEVECFELLNDLFGFEYLEREQLISLSRMLSGNLLKIREDLDYGRSRLSRVDEYAEPLQELQEEMISCLSLIDRMRNIECILDQIDDRLRIEKGEMN